MKINRRIYIQTNARILAPRLRKQKTFSQYHLLGLIVSNTRIANVKMEGFVCKYRAVIVFERKGDRGKGSRSLDRTQDGPG